MSKSARFSWRDLTPQIFAIIVFPLIALLLLVTYGGLSLHRHSMRTMVGERDQRAAQAAASILEEELRHRLITLRSLGQIPTIKDSGEGLRSTLSEAEHVLEEFDRGLAMIDSEGKVLAYIGDNDIWSHFDPGLMPAFEPSTSANLKELLVKTSLPQSSEPLNYLFWPLGDGVSIVGAFTPAVVIEKALADVFDPEGQSVTYVLDGDSRLLYTIGILTAGEELSSHPGVQEALGGQSGATYIQVGDDEHVIAYSPVPSAGWALVVEEKWEDLTSPLLRVTEDAPLLLFPILAVSLVALWFVTRQIIQPLQSLENQAAKLAWGDYAAIEQPVGGITEIRRLQTELVHLASKVRSAEQGLRGYISAITLGQEEERRRLARELHDDTLQSLIALNQRVQLTHLSHNGSAETNSLAEIQGLTEDTIQNLRRITRALRPIYLEDLGLVAALEMLARETQQSSNLRVEFKRNGQERRLSSNVELALYRIAQEALNNAVRHAQASQAKLEIDFYPDKVTQTVSDNGTGFEVPESPAEFAPNSHFGFLGLYERAEMIGAQLDIASEPGHGTRVTLSLELSAASQQSEILTDPGQAG